MGDLVQTLPALSDAARAFPDIRFDWAVDESFAQIPTWHPHVQNIFTSAFRRWGRNLGEAQRSGEISSFLRLLRTQHYDAVVDVQGEWKSATISWLAKGPRRGYDGGSVHEWGAHLTYSKRFAVPKGQHSIQRMRRLLSKALDYSYDESTIDYQIVRSRLTPFPHIPSGPYVVLVHSTSWEAKNWPENYWRELATRITAAGFQVVIPWGSLEEEKRAERIAAGDPRTFVLPQLTIAEKAFVISRAAATVGLDTGLSHIAAALDIPSVTIYGATDPNLVGATGQNQTHMVSSFVCVKCHEMRCSYAGPTPFKPACLVELTPERVWEELEQMLDGK
jgi:heptosyltransferase-1